MQTLSNMPISDIRVGERVKSKRTNVEGFIFKIFTPEEATRKEDYEFFIKWDNGNVSLLWKFFCIGIWVM